MFFDLFPVVNIFFSVADPDPGSGAFLTPGYGFRNGKKIGSGSRMNIPDQFFLELRNNVLG
jgi:hypothetical protein